MNKLRVAIIEDEIPAARLLHSMIETLRPKWDIIILPGNVEESVKWFSENTHPDLIFLDIQLSDGIAFEFLSQSKPSSTIIFTTAYDEYAIRAFSVNSIDYILKPLDEQRLLDAIVKYEKLRFNIVPNYLETILESLNARDKKYRTRFLITGVDKFWTLQVEDIAYFYSENKITFAVTKQGKEHIVNIPLSKLNEQLNPDRFFRANRQILLSIESIVSVEPYFNNRVIVAITPHYKSRITISENKIQHFKVWLNF